MGGNWWARYDFIVTVLLIVSMGALAFAAYIGGAF